MYFEIGLHSAEYCFVPAIGDELGGIDGNAAADDCSTQMTAATRLFVTEY